MDFNAIDFNFLPNSLGLKGKALRTYLENVGGTPDRELPDINWRNRFYGMPNSYDPGAYKHGKYAQPIKAIERILGKEKKSK